MTPDGTTGSGSTVRGHWRRLVDKQGQPYRTWVNGHIKGPTGAPLLHGEKVAVLAR